MADAKSELAAIKRFGGTPQKNSGRGMRKGDAILEPFLVDVKEAGKSFTLNRSVWAKVSTDAIVSEKRQPALNVIIGDERPTRLWVVSEVMFMEMLDAWRKVNEV